MPAPLSSDLRKRIIDAKKRGDTEATIAKEKDVSPSVVTKLWALYSETGSYEPRLNPCGRKSVLSLEELDRIRQSVNDRPDITLKELIEKLSLPVGKSALSVAIRYKLGLVFKKNAIPLRTKSRRRQNKT
jgi:transposase